MNYSENGCMGLRVRLQTQNFPDTLRSTGRKFLKRILTYCTRCNEINIRHSDIKIHVSSENLLNTINILYTGSHIFL